MRQGTSITIVHLTACVQWYRHVFLQLVAGWTCRHNRCISFLSQDTAVEHVDDATPSLEDPGNMVYLHMHGYTYVSCFCYDCLNSFSEECEYWEKTEER